MDKAPMFGMKHAPEVPAITHIWASKIIFPDNRCVQARVRDARRQPKMR